MGIVTVAYHSPSDDVPKGMLDRILKDAGLKKGNIDESLNLHREGGNLVWGVVTDVPGCYAGGQSRERLDLMKEALQEHIDYLM